MRLNGRRHQAGQFSIGRQGLVEILRRLLGAACGIKHVCVIRQDSKRILSRSNGLFGVFSPQIQADERETRRRFIRVGSNRLVDQLGHFVCLATCLGAQLGQSEQGLNVFRVLGNDTVKMLFRFLRLLVSQIQISQARRRREVRRIDRQRLLEALARTGQVALADQNRPAQIMGKRIIRLFLFEPVDGFQRLIEFASPELGGNQRHVSIDTGVERSNFFQLAVGGVGFALGEMRKCN